MNNPLNSFLKHETLKGWKRGFRLFADLVFPRVCVICQIPILDPDNELLCSGCLGKIEPTLLGCMKCGAPIKPLLSVSDKPPKSCRHCEKRKWSFRRAHCYTIYSGPAKQVIRKMKQSVNEPLTLEVGRRLGSWLVESKSFDVSRMDRVVCIPQHWFRRLSVRYNQAEVLGACVARSLCLPFEPHALYRTKWVEKQGVKNLENRLKDVQNSFAASNQSWIKGSSILLVDDVVTSGATAQDAARALKKAGAIHVEVAAFARALGSKNPAAVLRKSNAIDNICDLGGYKTD